MRVYDPQPMLMDLDLESNMCKAFNDFNEEQVYDEVWCDKDEGQCLWSCYNNPICRHMTMEGPLEEKYTAVNFEYMYDRYHSAAGWIYEDQFYYYVMDDGGHTDGFKASLWDWNASYVSYLNTQNK